jgi:hypothetical protein
MSAGTPVLRIETGGPDSEHVVLELCGTVDAQLAYRAGVLLWSAVETGGRQVIVDLSEACISTALLKKTIEQVRRELRRMRGCLLVIDPPQSPVGSRSDLGEAFRAYRRAADGAVGVASASFRARPVGLSVSPLRTVVISTEEPGPDGPANGTDAPCSASRCSRNLGISERRDRG